MFKNNSNNFNIKKGIAKRIILNSNKFDFNEFKQKLNKFVVTNGVYLIRIKFRIINRGRDEKELSNYFIKAGSQFPFKNEDESSVYSLWVEIQNYLEKAYYLYDIKDEDIKLVEVYFQIVVLKSDLDIDNNIHKLKSSTIKGAEKLVNIPLNISEKSLGKKLKVKYEMGLVTSIIGNPYSNAIQKLYERSGYLKDSNPKQMVNFDNRWIFYKFNDNILAICIIDSNIIEKILFDINGGILLHVKDTIIDNEMFKRNQGKHVFWFKGNNFVYSSTSLDVPQS